ncbi:hypothetical protein V5O48_004838 [Marasmius crinis-equi]|uniref:F-box domain-containing protein n=1 Tax=Marasmius crinis-equi TaxID=585013 RepID=A0ABR3FPZ4_9AGAR
MPKQKQEGRQNAIVLHRFKEMPLEIIYEIFCLVAPHDLLRLTRTSKALRKILMSKSSLFVWKASRESAGVPAPMSTMSEPAFARLLFDQHCHFCLTAVVRGILWELMVRCCRECRECDCSALFTTRAAIEEKLFDKNTDYPDVLWKIFPRYHEFPDGSPHSRLFLAQPTRAILLEFEALRDDQRDDWLAGQVEACRTRSKVTRIVSKLEESGWSNELRVADVRNKLQGHELVYQMEPLTDRTWNEIKPVLDEFFRTDIAALVDTLRSSTSRARFDALIKILGHQEQELPRELVFPAVLDIASWQPFRTIIEDPPVWEGSSSSAFDEALLLLPSYVQDWNDKRYERISHTLQAVHLRPTNVGPLLATSLFQCSRQGCVASRCVRSFPSILFHKCSYNIPGQPDWVPYSYWLRPPSCLKLITWSSDSLAIERHSTGVPATQTTCQLFNLDPSTTTLDSMFKLNPLVECLSCKTETGSRLFLRWTAVVDHTHHDNLRAASDEEEEIVSTLEQSVDERRPSLTRFRCRHCTFRSISMKSMSTHMATSHGIPTMQDHDWEFYPFCSMSEILSLLTPYDLLRLSRTSKDLRKILMSKSSLSVWKASRNNAGVPDPMPTMSEPAFARLLFDSHCHFCLTAVVKITPWEIMARCCRKCRDFNLGSAFIPKRDIARELFDGGVDYPEVLWQIFPQYHEKASGYPLPFGLFLAEPTKGILMEFKALKDDQRDSWLEEKLKETKTHTKYVTEYRKWETGQTREHELERDMAKDERFQAIVGKLEESGWSNELRLELVREKLRKHKLVNQTRPLTDRIWNNIRPALDEFFRTDIAVFLGRYRFCRNTAWFEALVTILRRQEQELSRELVFPAIVDIASWEPFRMIVEDLPLWEGFSSSLFDEALLLLPPFIRDWNNSRSDLVLEALRAAHVGATPAALVLSTSLFQCSRQDCIASRSVHSFPSILFHRCSNDTPRGPDWVSHPCSPRWDPKLMKYSSEPLSIQCHSTAVPATQTICQLFNLDPTTTTLDTMFKLNPLVECLTCKTEAGSRLFLRWTSVVDHPHYNNLNAASAGEEAIVLVQEQSVKERQPRSSRFRCRYCTFRALSMDDMNRHLATRHG